LNISKTYAIIQKIEFVTAEIENTKMSVSIIYIFTIITDFVELKY